MLLAGCASQPTEQVVLGDTVMQVDFGPSTVWQEYVHAEQNVDFQIESFLFRKSLQFPDLDEVARSVTHP